jgi:chaperonin GroEL
LILEDIAVTTGGKVVSKDKGMTMDKLSLEWLGEANLVTVDKTSTTIVDGKGKTEDIEKRALELQEQINKSTSPYETEKLNERLSKFSGGVHIIHVGGNTETEMKEKKDRIDDAIHAAKAAYAEGIVPGGGIALLRAKENISNVDTVGGKIIYEVCSTPFNYILLNAGLDQQKISKIQTTFELNHNNKWEGYNIKEDNVGNMESFGIIDPTKVTRNAIQNAVSVAGTLLLTEGIIVDEKEENKNNEGIDPSMFM